MGRGSTKCLGDVAATWTPDGRFFIFQSRHDGRLDLWALPEERRFPWRKRDDKPIQLTAGPLNFEFPLPSKDGKEIFAIGIRVEPNYPLRLAQPASSSLSFRNLR